MELVGLLDTDFVNYKKSNMTLMFPYCDLKCEKECGLPVCQNSELANAPTIETTNKRLVETYVKSDVTHAIVCQGLEPLDSWKDLFVFVKSVREQYYIQDDIVIYTGYNKDEILDKIEILKQFKNIVIKYGRFIPNRKPRYDKVLGVELASDNQYAEKIS